MNAIWSDLPPGSIQNDAQKCWNLWKSVKIVENPRWVPYKNRWKITFWPRPGYTLQKSVIFTFGALLITFRQHFAPSIELSWIFTRKLFGSIWNLENERVWKRFASWKRAKRCAKMMKYVKIRENHRKSSMSTLQKLYEKCSFDHVQVTLCKKNVIFTSGTLLITIR